MLSVANVSPSFGSTKIVIKPEEMKQSAFEVVDKYMGPVKKYYQTQAALLNWNGKPATSQMVADELKIGEAAYKMKGDTITLYGKDKVSDSFIGKLYARLFPENTKFTEDIK